MRSRHGVVLGLVVLAALVLSGCTEVGSVVTKAGIDLGLQNLTSRLEEIPSVTSVTPTAKITPDFGYTVDVLVVVDELVEEDLLGIVEEVRAVVASDAFANVEQLTYAVEAPGDVRFSEAYPFSIPSTDVQKDVHYWIELTSAYGGALSMWLYPAFEDGTGAYLREISAAGEQQDPDPDWAAMRSVPDSSRAAPTWTLGGISFRGEFPPDTVLLLRDDLARLAMDDTEFVTLDQYSPGYVTVQFLTPSAKDLTSPATSSAWPRALAAVELIVAANLPLVSFAYYADGNQGISNVHFGQCEGEISSSETDDSLWEALSTSTIDLPVGSGVGFCSYA